MSGSERKPRKKVHSIVRIDVDYANLSAALIINLIDQQKKRLEQMYFFLCKFCRFLQRFFVVRKAKETSKTNAKEAPGVNLSID